MSRIDHTSAYASREPKFPDFFRILLGPLWVEMTRARHFNQVFLEDVRVPVDNLVGPKRSGMAAGIARG